MSRLLINILFCFFLVFACGCNAKQEELHDASTYLENAKNEYKLKKTYTKEVVDNLVEAAKRGNDKAQLSLGVAYSDKKSSNYDYDKAVYWLKKQVEKNNYQAMYILAMTIQEYDYKNAEDYLLIEKLLNLVKDNGEPDAYLDLATLYYFAPKEFMNLEKKYKYSLDAANNKNAFAYYLLGEFYEKGLSPVEKDINKSIYWYELGAKQKNVNSLNKLALIYAYGLGVKKII